MPSLLVPLTILLQLALAHCNGGDPWESLATVSSAPNSSEPLEALYREERPWCPPSADILPCTCDGPAEFLLFHCDRITDLFDVSRATSTVGPYGAARLGKFSLTNSRVPALEGNLLGHLRFEYVFLRKNTVKRIGEAFFDSSRDSLKRIEVVHNDVEKFPFRELASFARLEYIGLKYNSIKSIPDDAFGRVLNDRIRQIDLSFNKINHVGSNAFKYLTHLEKLDLRHNRLTVINNLAFAATRQNPRLVLQLAGNRVMFVAEGAFQNQVFRSLNLTDNNLTAMRENAFREVLKGMAERRTGTISIGGNRLRCTCEKVEWLVRLPTLYKLPILDFDCSDKDGVSLQDLTIQELGCTASTTQ